jgi:hypothetical protein
MIEMGSSGVRRYMSRERAYGALFLALGTLSLLVYLMSFFAVRFNLSADLKGIAARFHSAAVELPVLVLMVAFLFILIRIGWNMLTAPPEKSLEEQEATLSRS